MVCIFNNIACTTIGLVVLLLVCIIAYCKRALGYWKRKGVRAIQPYTPLGQMEDVFIKKIPLSEIVKKTYDQFKSEGLKYGGTYFFLSPIFVPIDLDLVKRIMQTDFEYFPDHGGYVNEEVDPLSGHLFALRGEKWKNLRAKLSPTFTSGKMRMMFPTLVECTHGLKGILDNYAEKQIPTDIKEVLARFTTDIIGSCAFGIECNSMSDPDSEFRKLGKMITKPSFEQNVRNLVQGLIPENFLKMVNFRVFPRSVSDFLTNMVKETIQYREENEISRKDFLQLLIQLKNTGQISEKEYTTTKAKAMYMTLPEITAQCYIFFLAGFETSATTNSFILYELAEHQDLQDKLRNEIKTVLEKHGGALTYDAIQEMTYMDKVIQESLRKYSSLPAIMRLCAKDYTVPGTSVVIEKGRAVFIPVAGIQNDPEYYPNPDVFDPERFSEDAKKQRHQFTWLPFGEGPRICIGMRFGLMQAKVGLATVISNYKVFVSKKTYRPIKFDSNSFLLAVKGGIWLDIEKI